MPLLMGEEKMVKCVSRLFISMKNLGAKNGMLSKTFSIIFQNALSHINVYGLVS